MNYNMESLSTWQIYLNCKLRDFWPSPLISLWRTVYSFYVDVIPQNQAIIS